MFGAWQAGAWSILADHFAPDLIVGASVGSLNGYLIASGVTPGQLREYWLEPRLSRFKDLDARLKLMTERHQLRMPFALTVTEWAGFSTDSAQDAPGAGESEKTLSGGRGAGCFALKPRIFRDGEITWRHLAASCALPLFFKQVRIEGRLYTDGGLLNPLPVWAAVELGATRILGLNALPEVPSSLLRPFIKGFRRQAGHNPPLPPGVRVDTLIPSRPLGTVTDAVRWRRPQIERWLDLGAEDAAAFLRS